MPKVEKHHDIKIKRGGYTVARVKTDKKKIPLVGLGDSHLGAPTCDKQKFTETIDWIKEHGALWVGMGDLIECATKSSVGAGVYEQIQSPQEQIDTLIPMLEPIKKQCLGMIKGNHEERAYKTTGLDPMTIICHALDIPYFGWEFYGIITGAQIAYSIYAVHSYTGNKTTGLAMNWTEREILPWIDADIIMRGHSHDVGFEPKDACRIDKKNMAVINYVRYIAMTGHYLRRENSYIAARGSRPKTAGTIVLWLNMDKHNRGVKPEYLI